jgi:hypothetical protein
VKGDASLAARPVGSGDTPISAASIKLRYHPLPDAATIRIVAAL